MTGQDTTEIVLTAVGDGLLAGLIGLGWAFARKVLALLDRIAAERQNRPPAVPPKKESIL